MRIFMDCTTRHIYEAYIVAAVITLAILISGLVLL